MEEKGEGMRERREDKVLEEEDGETRTVKGLGGDSRGRRGGG